MSETYSFSRSTQELQKPIVQQENSAEQPVQMTLAPSSAAVAQSQELQLQMKRNGEKTEAIHAAAARGIQGSGSSLPHLNAIQRSFGHHNISNVQAHVGGAATEANRSMGAEAYATGNHVAFKEQPSLHTAAHEAAHVVQQQSGVSLKGNVGQIGDRYEQHADTVADAVVQGKSSETLLDQVASGGGSSGHVQQKSEGDGTDRVLDNEADQILSMLQELLLDIESPEEPAGEASAQAPEESTQQQASEVGQLRETISQFTALKGNGDPETLRISSHMLLEALEGKSSSSRTAVSPEGQPPVQQVAAVAAAPLVVAGPPGWLVLGVLAVGTLAAMAYTYEQTRVRSRPRTRTRRRSPNHRGRLQVQGGGLELSYPWSRSGPMTKAEASAGLLGLRAQLNRRELSLRDQAFVRAENFIMSTLHTAPPPLSRTFQNSNLPRNNRDARVDIEIWTGMAFV